MTELTWGTPVVPVDPVVLYHAACKDGFAAAWAHHRFAMSTAQQVDYVPVYHGTEPQLFMLRDRDVVMLDFVYKRAAMIDVGDVARSLLVLDHHQSAADDLAELALACPYEITFDMQRSGAGLSWDRFHNTRRPWLIDYIEDRDLWRHKMLHTREINAYLSTLEFDFAVWDRECDTFRVTEVVAKGETIAAKTRQYVRETAKNARRLVFEGHVVPVVNAPQSDISELLAFLARGYAFSVGWCQLADGTFKYSLRSVAAPDAVDVSKIAAKYGGGGHPTAAAFQALNPIHFTWATTS